MGEAKRRAERRRAERESASQVVIVRPDAPEAPPTRRYRQKLVDFMPEVYAAIEEERAAFNADPERDIKMDFDGFVNALLVVALERERAIREAAAQQAKLVQAVPANIVDQVLAKNRAALR